MRPRSVWPGMPEKDFKQIGEYVRDVADRIGLRDWSFMLVRFPVKTDDAFASVKPIPGRKHADIRLCEDFLELNHDKRRMTIVHELLHCHLDPASEILRRVATQLGTLAYEPVWEAFSLELETAIDGIATSIADLLPPYPRATDERRLPRDRHPGKRKHPPASRPVDPPGSDRATPRGGATQPDADRAADATRGASALRRNRTTNATKPT